MTEPFDADPKINTSPELIGDYTTDGFFWVVLALIAIGLVGGVLIGYVIWG